jgi:hypothetical protein
VNNHKTFGQQAQDAYDEMLVAKRRLLAAIVLAYPIGAEVVSHARTHPINGRVAGHLGKYQIGEAGGIVVRNGKTGKMHKAWPFSGQCKVELVDKTDGSELA